MQSLNKDHTGEKHTMMELVTGGSGSGKSAYAESAVCRLHGLLCRKTGERTPLYYIADMVRTLEWYQDLSGKLIQEGSPSMENTCVLLECVSNLTANEMYMEGGAGERTVEAVVRGVGLLKKKCRETYFSYSF